MTQSILICDDHSLLLQTLKEFLQVKIPTIRVSITEDFNNFIAQFNKPDNKFNLVIIDFRMPGISGLDTIKQLINNPNNTPVAVMSGNVGHSEIVEFMESGAIGFIPKTLSSMGMVNAINLMLCGETYVPSALIGEKQEKFIDKVKMTQREIDVLRKLHLGYSNKEIARQLDIEEITVKVYVSRLCKLLNVKNRTQVVVTALSRSLL